MWWIVGAIGLGFAGWGVLSAHRARYPEHHQAASPRPLPPHTTHLVTAPDGAAIPVWLLAPAAPRGLLLLCHGYFADYQQVSGIARGLHDRGYEVLLFELRGHGGRPGPCTFGIREVEDAVAVLRWRGARDAAAPLPLGVLGLSMGAAVMCQVAARVPEVRAVVADSIYPRLFTVLTRLLRERYRLPAVPWAWLTWWSLQVSVWRRLSPLDPIAAAPRLHQPLLAIHGGEDRRVPAALGREVYDRWAGPKEWWSEPEVAHVAMFDRGPDAYCDRVARFFDRALAPSGVAG